MQAILLNRDPVAISNETDQSLSVIAVPVRLQSGLVTLRQTNSVSSNGDNQPRKKLCTSHLLLRFGHRLCSQQLVDNLHPTFHYTLVLARINAARSCSWRKEPRTS